MTESNKCPNCGWPRMPNGKGSFFKCGCVLAEEIRENPDPAKKFAEQLTRILDGRGQDVRELEGE